MNELILELMTPSIDVYEYRVKLDGDYNVTQVIKAILSNLKHDSGSIEVRQGDRVGPIKGTFTYSRGSLTEENATTDVRTSIVRHAYAYTNRRKMNYVFII